jgi:addiction module RelE/StbE family toxin
MKLAWTKRAQDDLISIGKYIAGDNIVNARKWIKKLRARVRRIIDAPMSGRVVPEFENDNIREVFLGNYRIVYLVQNETVLIITIFEGHKLLVKTPL